MRVLMRRVLALLPLLACTGCRDVSGFSTHGDSYAGGVTNTGVDLAGVDPSTILCLTLDTNHLQDTPGSVWSSDDRFVSVPMRTIPQIWADPLSTLQFGDGRLRNLVYVARASAPYTDGNGNDVVVVLSLMPAGDIQARLVRGAPVLAPDGGAGPAEQSVFAVFDLTRQSGPCSF
jgi:hypothetical protein